MNNFKKFQIIFSIILVVTSLLVLGAEIFSYGYLSQVQANITEQQYRLDKTDEREQILSDLTKKYNQIEDTTTLINTALPDKKDSSKLMADLDSLAADSGLKLTLLSSDSTASKKTSSQPELLQTISGQFGYELPLNVNVQGSFGSLQTFIKKVENYQRLINITSVEISQDQQKPSDLIQAKLKITAYIKK